LAHSPVWKEPGKWGKECKKIPVNRLEVERERERLERKKEGNKIES